MKRATAYPQYLAGHLVVAMTVLYSSFMLRTNLNQNHSISLKTTYLCVKYVNQLLETKSRLDHVLIFSSLV